MIRPNLRRSVPIGVALASVAVICAATSYGVSRSLAQAAQNPAQAPPPTFRTEANYVRVDAYPTKGGEPVSDLTQADFEVLENAVPQKLEQFEHVTIRGNLPQDVRSEPNTVEQSRQALENPRARVFVVFLDVNHVSVEGSHAIRKPLVDALNRLIGPDDLVAVMTPEMAAGDLAFARKTTTIEGFLTRYWTWGERDQMNSRDPQEDRYRACYPGLGPTAQCKDDDRGVADEMIERRREKQTINALEDLVRYLRGVREERKAIITVSDGWRLFRPDPRLSRQLYCQPPTGNPVSVDPRTGRLTTKAPPSPSGIDPASCDADRTLLAYMDDDQQFREILSAANTANASFYPIDPRGLAVFDEPIAKPGATGLPPPGSTTITPPSVDSARLQARLTSLRTLAEATDGLAMVNSNDLSGSFRKIVSDLSSYYLLGYYSSGKLDGKFHPITVRVKRPGVQVRARRGYLAATPGAATAAAATAAANAMPAKVDAEAAAVSAAVAPLAGFGREVPMRLQVAAGWKPGSVPAGAVWVVGELGATAEFADAWKGGAVADVELLGSGGAAVATGRATVAAGSRAFRLALTSTTPLAAGEYALRVGARAGSVAIPVRETLRFVLRDAPEASGALWIRRGQSTGNREVATADLRFRRNEQVRVEIPTLSAETGNARLLDRTGKALTVPVTAAVRDDADGSRWRTAQLALAPLAPGDYVIELSEGDQRMLTGFRVVQ
jgi:VWFA-related protein